MRFGVLGSLEVVGDDGRAVDVGGSQPRHLLAMLVVASGRIVPVDALIEGVWGERPPGSAAGTLQSYVSRLRRTIDPNRTGGEAKMLVWEPPGYRLNVDSEQVDFRRFEHLADEGRELLDAGSPAEARERLGEAIGLWRGPALVEFADEEFARGVAARLEDRRLAAIEDRLAADLALGRHAAVIGELTELVAAHPLREGLWAHLALALYRSGRQAEALRAIDEMRRVLRDELGVDPSRQIRELESAILSHDPTLDRPDQPPPVSAQGSVQRARASAEHVVGAATRLVGRVAEVEELRAMLGDALAGRSRLALIEGEAGIGKTRLLEQVGDDAAASGAEVLWGRSYEATAAPVLWPWLNLLRMLLERDDTPPSDREAADVLSRLLAASGASGGLPTIESNRFVLLEAIARLLERASRQAPLVILLDDLQWADPMSLELLEFLVGRVVGSRVFYAATLRDTEATANDVLIRALATLSSRPGSRRLTLGAVKPEDAADLVELATAQRPSEEVAAAIYARAEGNPFFIGELARLMVARGGLESGTAEGLVPASVRDVIRGRLSHLSSETRDLLQIAAVIGREVDVDLLARSADLDLASCLDRIEPAADMRLLEPIPARPSTFRFSHALIREVVLDEISALRRARLHLRVADALEAARVSDDEAEILAEHLWHAMPLGVAPRAAAALEQAARVAVRRYAHGAAEQLLERALELRGAMVPPDDEAELLTLNRIAAIRRMRLGYTLSATHGQFDRAKLLAGRTGREDLLVELLWAEWAGAATACDFPAAESLAVRLLQLGEASSEPAIRAAGYGAWGVQRWHAGQITESAESLDRAVELIATGSAADWPPGLTEHLVLTTSFSVLVHELAGDRTDGEARIAALAEAHTEAYPRVIAWMFGAISGAVAGDALRTERAARQGIATDPDNRFPFFTAASEIMLGWALAERGDLEAGLLLLANGGRRYRDVRVRTIVPYYVSLRAVAEARDGQLARARERVGTAARLQRESGERWLVPLLHLHDAQIAQLEGRPAAEIEALLARSEAEATAQGALGTARRAAELIAQLR